MKKIISLLLVLLLVGAGGFYSYDLFAEKKGKKIVEKKSNLKAGTYTAEFDKPDFRGWKAFFEMTIDDTGEITYVKYDYVNANGQFKTQDTGYNRAMMNKNGVGPKNYCIRFEKNLIIYQQPDKVDSITGATHSYHYFKDFAKAAFIAAEKGDTSKIYLPQPEAVDPEKVQKANNAGNNSAKENV